jgi:TrmH family RNA methyltransferase
MSRIESPTNPRIAAAVRAVADGGRMLLEGQRMVEDALDAAVPLQEVFVQDETLEGNEDFLKRLGEADAGAILTPVSGRVLRRLSDLPSTRGIAALASPPHRALTSFTPSGNSLFLLLDEIQDPANVGAIVRCAEAFGVAGVVLTPGSAGPFSPRALRASAGSALRVPIAPRVAPGEVIGWARTHGAILAGAEAHGGETPATAAKLRPLVLVVGSEGHGISAALEAALDRRLTLPLGGRVDSLNAAVAAGLLLFVLTRT